MVAVRKQAERPKKDIPIVRCDECDHSHLVRWGRNPVISICAVRKSFGRPYRMVAGAEHKCEAYARFKGIIKDIEQK